MKCFQAFMFMSVLVYSSCANFLSGEEIVPTSTTKLKFNSKGEFKILQFTDLHYGEDETKDKNSQILQGKLIQTVKPDLVVITGDAVSGYAWDKSDTFYQKNWSKWTNPMEVNKVKYAYTLGNHDDQANLSRQEILDLDKTNPFSITKQSINITGITNYILPISSFNDTQKIVTMLWFFDTNDVGCQGRDGWGCINPDQINWYKNKSNEIIEITGRNVEGLAFFHIPLPEYKDLWNNGKTYGKRNEGVCSPDYNTGFFNTSKVQGNIKAMFCGHDHSNYYGGYFKDIELVYGRKTGYGGYGPDGFQRGARIINLKDNQNGSFSYEHEIIQEDLTFVKNGEPTWQGDKFVTNCTG